VHEVFESYNGSSSGKLLPIRNLPSALRVIPFLRELYPTYAAYANATSTNIFGEQKSKLTAIRVTSLESVVMINRGDSLDVTPLPLEAQLAPVFGISVADFDADGSDDLFLAQNFFGTRPDFPRMDAGQGLLLKGEGDGGFKAMTSAISGIRLTGEQRGSAVADFDRDGRVDLLAGQNAGETKLYINMMPQSGIRVYLSGQNGNPSGVGAKLRLGTETKLGPAREVRAGGGYRSQDAAIQVLSLGDATPTRLQVAWPNGKITTTEIAEGASEITVREPTQ
jgi:hypothetical protein